MGGGGGEWVGKDSMGLLLYLGFMVPCRCILGGVFRGERWGTFSPLDGSGSVLACETLFRATTHRVLRIESEILFSGRGFFVRCSGKEPSLEGRLAKAEDVTLEGISVNPLIDRSLGLVVHHPEVFPGEAHVGHEYVVPCVHHLAIPHPSPAEVDDDRTTSPEMILYLFELWRVHPANVEEPTPSKSKRLVQRIMQSAVG